MDIKIKKITETPRFAKVKELEVKKAELIDKCGDLFGELVELALASEDEKVKEVAVNMEAMRAEVNRLEDEIEMEKGIIMKELEATVEDAIRTKLGENIGEDSDD